MEHLLHGEGGVEFISPSPESYSMRRQLEASLEKFIKENPDVYKVQPKEKRKPLSPQARQKRLEEAVLGIPASPMKEEDDTLL